MPTSLAKSVSYYLDHSMQPDLDAAELVSYLCERFGLETTVRPGPRATEPQHERTSEPDDTEPDTEPSRKRRSACGHVSNPEWPFTMLHTYGGEEQFDAANEFAITMLTRAGYSPQDVDRAGDPVEDVAQSLLAEAALRVPTLLRRS